MASLSVVTFLLLVAASSVQAGLSDQTFSWVDLSTGVAATVAICVFFVGIGFIVYELGFRDYLAEVRTNGKPFAEDLSDFVPSEPSTIEAMSEIEKVEMEIDLPVGVVDEDELPVYDGVADAVAEAATVL